jgi:hypothetical protein
MCYTITMSFGARILASLIPMLAVVSAWNGSYRVDPATRLVGLWIDAPAGTDASIGIRCVEGDVICWHLRSEAGVSRPQIRSMRCWRRFCDSVETGS